jgi:stage V sporulation protein R
MSETRSNELRHHAEVIAEYARTEGLDFYETVFEVLSSDEMNQVAAYGGFPQRYPHWRHGMEYEKLRKQHSYGLAKIYEMVINNDPCYAYLREDNPIVDQKTVMAHVYAHCDFFKNNQWFSQTNRKMIDEMANHATRVRRYINRFGLEPVEEFLDVCLSLENLIDPYSVFIRRRPIRRRITQPKQSHTATRYPAKEYMDRFINPPEAMQNELREKREADERAERAMPPKPERDILLFLLENAPMRDWQADVLNIIREEAYYYAPQGQTKIMNEGWATYWHSTLMTRYCLEASELVTYAEHHSGTVATSPGRLNPYKVGLELFRDIEKRWNTGRHGREYEACDDLQTRKHWKQGELFEGRAVALESPGRKKIYEVRKIYNDVMFLDEFLTPEFVDEQDLYHYRFDPNSGRMVAVDRDFDRIKRQMLFGLTNMAQPYIFVLDGNYRNRGELYLGHQHHGVDLEIKTAKDTLRNVQTIWGRPVHLEAKIDEERMLFTHDGEQVTQQHIDTGIDEPAHSI